MITKSLILCIIFFSLSTYIGISECIYFARIVNNDILEIISYQKFEFQSSFFEFNLGNYEFSGIEQIIFILLNILGFCALLDITESYKKDNIQYNKVKK